MKQHVIGCEVMRLLLCHVSLLSMGIAELGMDHSSHGDCDPGSHLALVVGQECVPSQGLPPSIWENIRT